MRRNSKQQGFSLLELVFGIVLLGIVMTGALVTLINLSPNTVSTVMDVRAAQFSQRLLNDIASQKYDHANEYQTCGSASLPCTPAENYGPELAENETTLASFDDVDDYHTPAICAAGLASCVDEQWIPACWFTTEGCSGSNAAYQQFLVRIIVSPASFINKADASNLCDTADCAKNIELSIKQPNGVEWQFAVLRGNYQ